mmetsp:Transcript_36162/g.85744  ORF Transcript_36162/g.85744 Transcript_36162/m.85744 type:complete len:224 (+) Transcript_36162:412-1083(+)
MVVLEAPCARLTTLTLGNGWWPRCLATHGSDCSMRSLKKSPTFRATLSPMTSSVMSPVQAKSPSVSACSRICSRCSERNTSTLAWATVRVLMAPGTDSDTYTTIRSSSSMSREVLPLYVRTALSCRCFSTSAGSMRGIASSYTLKLSSHLRLHAFLASSPPLFESSLPHRRFCDSQIHVTFSGQAQPAHGLRAATDLHMMITELSLAAASITLNSLSVLLTRP